MTASSPERPDSDTLVSEPHKKKGSAAEARRLRMREFQSHLQSRMANALQSERHDGNQLGLLIGTTHFLIELKEAGEIFEAQSITPVPLTHDWYLGLTNLRGVLTNVIDLGCFYGAPLTPVERDSRIIAFSPDLGINAGLLVSRVLGLRDVRQMRHQADASPASEDQASWHAGAVAGKQYIDSAEQTWFEIKLAAIAEDPRFLNVGI